MYQIKEPSKCMLLCHRFYELTLILLPDLVPLTFLFYSNRKTENAPVIVIAKELDQVSNPFHNC